ncbi:MULTISPECIES: glycosyl transferase [unclassified Achromobacter]|uniref:glycosyl transferase n=1 Tax=unclassified Achromobacter TaxID=2626865 RepID=UPI000B51C0E5|nr:MULTISPECIES: glycosyl transferase [unclassified Achromobacter]OWT74946.1 glycosyl transferase [Achromobacter sp. HZ28]OWT76554.1 glycosyl transferase [Achromobacter sp. HZ34]
MKKIHVYTSAACNYIPKVRTLVRSIKKFHPDWVVHLALSDEVPADLDLSKEPFDEIHPLSSLEIPNYTGWAFCHTIVELSTAIKPFLLARLLEREDCEGVIYLDPDTVLFSRLDDVLESIKHSNIALTPHLVDAESSLAGIMDNEISCLRHGIYNLGFLAVAPTEVGKQFAQWWSDRLYYFCRAEIHNGLFTDQRWIDLVPAFFEGVCILRTPRLNAAPWNLSTRTITGDLPDNVMVDGEPLGFYHFTGFDSGAHKLMANKYAGDQATVGALIEWYVGSIAATDDDPLGKVVWAYSRFAEGTPIPKSARLVYRERLDLQRAFPDPFATDGGGYKAWWDSQARIEYPGLFDKNNDTLSIATQNLSAGLTPGYQAGGDLQAVQPGESTSSTEAPVSNSSSGVRRAKRAWEVLRTEGIGGIAKRIVK